jgi:putative membrane protein
MQGVRQILIRRSTARQAVDLASAACFWEQKIGFTKQHNAILLYVSIAEGQARLLPDAGVTAKIPDAKFGELSQRLNAGEGDATELVCGVIRDVSALVKDAFPRAAEDINEVPDKPVIRFP